MKKENRNSIKKNNCHSRKSLSGISTSHIISGADPRQKPSGMTTSLNCQVQPDLHIRHRGFTLIELLVVVLIIGILAAVALPQYQLTVDKSIVVPYINLAHQIAKAETSFYLANGTYTNDWRQLDIDFSRGSCTLPLPEVKFMQCPKDIVMSLTTSNNTVFINMHFCPGTNSGWWGCSYGKGRFFQYQIKLTNGNSGSVTYTKYGNSARVTRLYNALKKM